MWEVGGYLLIRHHGESKLCENLQFQKELLNDIQGRQDRLDQESCSFISPDARPLFTSSNIDDEALSQHFDEGCEDIDRMIFAEMDRLHSHRHGSSG